MLVTGYGYGYGYGQFISFSLDIDNTAILKLHQAKYKKKQICGKNAMLCCHSIVVSCPVFVVINYWKHMKKNREKLNYLQTTDYLLLAPYFPLHTEALLLNAEKMQHYKDLHL